MKSKPRLAKLASSVAALQTCVYCPKLCRAACPVANASASETLTPWGKMSLAFFAYRGDVPVDEPHARPAWACTGCHACRERCEHDNDVAAVLLRAREALRDAGAAPAAARRVQEGFPAHRATVRRALDDMEAPREPTAPTVLLIGCSYVRHCRDVARQVVQVAQHFVDGSLRVARECCGLPLLLAGDRLGFERAAHVLAEELADAARVIVADPGCAYTLIERYPAAEISIPPVQLLVDVIADGLERLPAGTLAEGVYRYLDPCQLGRGLGRYDPPRAILRRLTGRAPESLVRRGADAECSGGGGLLPLTHPEWSEAMSNERFAEHLAAGGGRLVTGCGGSLHRFRRSGHEVVDLVSLVAEAMG